ncbi:hypothetical protein Droror1_Dr00022394 [Drosera rotundifolia]
MSNQLKAKQIITTSAAIKSKQIADSSKLIALGFLESLVGLAYICAKQSRRAKRKLRKACTKRLMHYKSLRNGEDDAPPIWQRTILMGDKCQPVDFSGVINSGEGGREDGAEPRLPAKPSAGVRSGRLYYLSD